jgi:uncharacterized protein (TIGR00255 family)
MHSMTGYGRGEASNGIVTVVVELKSVNNRYRDIQMRLPRPYSVIEPRIQARLKTDISRGRIEVFVRRQATESGHRIIPDPLLAERYLVAANDVAKRLARPTDEIATSWVLSQPGVLNTVEGETDAMADWDIIQTAFDLALHDLIEMRKAEGTALAADLAKHLEQLEALQAEVASHSDGIVERLEKKLSQRIERLIGDRIDPGRLAQEAAVLADKADVAEEIARISSHCSQFRNALATDEPVGRKLDFLLQEINREINTIGSKAAELPVSTRVVDMKSVLERMREQAANVE